MKKLLSTLILAALLLTTAACSSDPASGTQDTTAVSTDETTVAETLPIEVIDFGGATVNMYLGEEFEQISAETETGDLINDAVYRRNSKVEDMYNVDFKFEVRPGNYDTGYNEWRGVVDASIAAGDNTYQIVGGYGYRFTFHTLGTSYHNLNANNYIDFTQPWWPRNIVEAGNIGDKMFIAFGNVDPSFYDETYVMYFNKNMADSLGINNFYEDVDSGKWTLDKMMEVTKTATADIDGNGTMDINDQFGYDTISSMGVDAYFQSCDIKLTTFDSDGMPQLVGLTEKYVDVQNRICNFLHQSGNAFVSNVKAEPIEVFMSGRALILSDAIKQSHSLREMEDDFGIIPYPKYEEAQEDYVTYNAIGNSCGYVIPITADADMGGALIEALAYYGYTDVLPEYFERALKTKSARDDESAAMLDLIFAGIEFDFTQFYSYCFGDQKSPSMLLRQVTRAKSTDMASAWAKDQELYDNTMTMIIETLK